MNYKTDDENGSQDLFGSQETSQGTNINEQIDITLQLTEFIWVQCDHPNCQKWRRVPAADANDLSDDPWYCSMNPDPTMNFCDAKEEDHRRYDRMAKKVGIKFVMSMLHVGTLVWARTAGYCRWPGIVTPDPMTGVHVHLDIDGDPHSYHVEYLGNPHTHSWVTAKFVEMYGHKDDTQTATSEKPSILKKGRKKKILRKPKNLEVSGSKKRTSYKNMRVEEVIYEADLMLDMSSDERMNFCVFEYDPKKQASFGFNETVSSTSKSQKRCSNCGENPLKKKRKLKAETEESTRGICNLLGIKDNCAAARKSEEKKKFITKRNDPSIMTKKSLCSPAREMSMVGLTNGAETNSRDALYNVIDSPNQFSQSKLKISSSMINKTKEEKFKIDIDVYMQNEKAFEHDVKRFMTRNDRTIKTTPVWHNVPVSLFQLFLAVHERGGFQSVCESKGWTRVYKELTDMQNVSSGSVAKHFYERNLYPYELYISGQDYTAALKKFVSLKPGPKKKKLETNVRPATEINNSSAEYVTSDYASYCSDIEAILGQLEDDYKAAISSDDAGKREMKKKLGVGLTFHDETPSSPSLKFATVPSEFDQKASDLASCTSAAQQVPSISFKDDKLNLDDAEEKILTEMKALEDQIKQMNDEIDAMI